MEKEGTKYNLGGIGRIAIVVNENGVTYKKQLKQVSRPQVAELIVVMDILIDELKQGFKGTKSGLVN